MKWIGVGPERDATIRRQKVEREKTFSEGTMNSNATIRIDLNKPFVISSKRYGVIKLRSLLSIGDFEILLNYLKTFSNSREFTVNVLNQVAFITPNEGITSWDDKTILMIARKWSKKTLFQEINERRIGNFEDFQSTVSEYVAHTNEIMLKALKQVSNALSDISKSIASQMSMALKGIGNILGSLHLLKESLTPLISDFQNVLLPLKTIAETSWTRRILTESEYELAPQIISTESLLALKGKRFSPAITNKLLGITRKDDFIGEVELLFSQPRLRKRQSVIRQALTAHKNRQYYLSTPVFIAQAEGLFTDWLISIKLIRRENGKTVAYNEKTTLNSLKPKVKFAGENLAVDGLLKVAIDNVLLRIVDRRNEILHGESNNYGTAKNSTQALLLVLLFASTLESEVKSRKENG